MTFNDSVIKNIEKRVGLFKNFREPTFVTTGGGQECAVFINQGLTCTDVILFYSEDGNLVSFL